MSPQARFVALLRGVNLGARNRISMHAFAEVLASLGAQDVQTYLQSGNAVFAVQGSAGLAARITAAIDEQLGLNVPVCVRSAEELAVLIEDSPFRVRGEDIARLHVTFLQSSPSRNAPFTAPPKGASQEEFVRSGKDVYLCCSGNYSDSKLQNAFFERHYGQVATTRNWRTVLELDRLAKS